MKQIELIIYRTEIQILPFFLQRCLTRSLAMLSAGFQSCLKDLEAYVPFSEANYVLANSPLFGKKVIFFSAPKPCRFCFSHFLLGLGVF